MKLKLCNMRHIRVSRENIKKLGQGAYEMTLDEYLESLPLEEQVEIVKGKPLKVQLAFLLKDNTKDIPKLEDIIKAIKEDEVFLKDVAFFSTENDLITIQKYRDIIQEYLKKGKKSYDVPFEITWNFKEIRDKVRKQKLEFLSKAAARYHLGDIEIKLNEFAGRIREKPSSYREAIKMIGKHLPSYPSIAHKITNIDWSEERFRKKITDAIDGEFKKMVPEDIKDLVTFVISWWYFPFLKVEYGRKGLNWYADIYIVANSKFRIKDGQYEFKIVDQSFSISLPDHTLGYNVKLLKPEVTDMERIFLFSTPLDLLSGLVKGEIEPEGYRIVEGSGYTTTYEANGFDDGIVLCDNFIEFIQSLGKSGNIWDELEKYRFLDDKTRRIVEEKMKNKSKHVKVNIKKKDKEYLRIIAEHREYMSYKEWGDLLGISKSGALRVLSRFEKMKLLSLDKSHGIKAFLTKLGREALE